MRKFAAQILLVTLACAGNSRNQRPVDGVEAPLHLAGAVSVAPTLGGESLKGNLAVYWLTAKEANDLNNGRHVINIVVQALQRIQGFRMVDPSLAPVHFVLPVPAGEVSVYAILDRKGEFLPTLLQEGGAGNLLGKTDPIRVGKTNIENIDLVLAQVVPPKPPKERCAGEHLRLEHVQAPQVAGSRQTSVDRRLCVSLPPSYEKDKNRRYPVIYSLPGLFSSDTGGRFFEISKNVSVHPIRLRE